jgi:PhzF family phenazine biosynthesis protein
VLSFRQVDVFSDNFLLGNPVAVVHDAEGVQSEDMAAFARWTNLSETTFLLPPTDPAADYRLRIFTPARELPFAGHPTLGSARAWLEAGGVPHREGLPVQECPAGLINLRQTGSRLAFAAPPLIRGGPVEDADLREIAAGLRLSVADVVDAQWCDNGPGWVGVLLRDADAVLAVEPDRAAMARFPDVGIVGPYRTDSVGAGSTGADFEVRAFMPEGSGEDPVTGSLNAALAQWLIGSGRAPSAYTASQGTRLRRRGRVHVEKLDDDIWVGGDTVIGITGTVAL